ncbi:patatin-like phospholipase family protein [Pseudomonadota bacterium]
MFANLIGRFRKSDDFILALGGGGGRGLAHLGVLEVLEEHKLRPSAIVGSSIGALFGAMYAINPDVKKLRSDVEEFLKSDAFTELKVPILDDTDIEVSDESWLSWLANAARQSILYTRAATDIAIADVNTLIHMSDELCSGKSFSDTKIPLYITSVEFPSGDCHLFSKGEIGRAVAASMAVPGVFDPVVIDGGRYVDGGLASELPAREAKMIARMGQPVVAVNVGARPHPGKEPTHVIGMIDWATRVKALYLRQYEKGYADVLVEPLVGFTQWHDFSHPDQEINRGRDAALEKMPELLKLISR